MPFPVPNPIVAGWRDDAFFISDRDRGWFISPGARLQVDFPMDYRHYWFPEQPWEVTAHANHMRGPTGHPSSYGELSVRAAINL